MTCVNIKCKKGLVRNEGIIMAILALAFWTNRTIRCSIRVSEFVATVRRTLCDVNGCVRKYEVKSYRKVCEMFSDIFYCVNNPKWVRTVSKISYFRWTKHCTLAVHVTFRSNCFKMAVFWRTLCPLSCASFSMIVGSYCQKPDFERWGRSLIS